MQINCYGFEASSQWFRRKSLDVYLMKEHEGVFYLCFGNQAVRPIHRIDKMRDPICRVEAKEGAVQLLDHTMNVLALTGGETQIAE